MRSERWSRVRELFERAVEVPPAERRRFLDETAGDDAEVRSEVERLLAAGADTTGFLTPPDPSRVERTLHVDAPPLAPGTRLGAYRIVRRVGSGGMGAVYEAVQERPERTVALKVMRDPLAGEDLRRRFQVEAEVLGRLRHPGLATVYEVGEERLGDGREVPFFALEFVAEARDLVTYAHEHGLALRERIGLFREVCAAVHHAHLAGVLHRDLKPDNLLVGADGRAKVIDYGVARAVDPAAAPLGLESRGDQIVGTLQYMAPEQLSRGPEATDARADVYALGLVLYELIAGERPYELAGRPLTDVVRIVCEEPVGPPSVAVPDLPRELDWIVLCALAREREERYESVAELSRDLGRYLANEPVLAAPASGLYRARKFVVRNRGSVLGGVLVVASLAAGVVGTTLALFEASDQRDVARAAVADLEQETVQKQAALDDLTRANARTQLALERQTAVTEAFEGLLDAVAPSEDGYQVTLFTLLERSRPRFDEAVDPLTRASLSTFFGDAYYALGLLRRAEEMYAEGLEAYGQVTEPAARLGAKLKVMLARLRADQLRTDEAEVLADEAEALLLEFPADADAADVGAELQLLRAYIASARGDLTAAEGILREAIAIFTVHFGADDVDVLRMRARWGFTLLRLHRYAESAAELRELWSVTKQTLGRGHPVTLETGNGLTQVLGALGLTDEALEHQREVVDSIERVHGPHSTAFVHGLHALLIAQLGGGRADEAVQVGARALRAFEEEHFTDLDLEVPLRSNYAIALGQLQRNAEAADELRHVVQILESQGQATSARMYEVQHNLGETLWRAEDFESAEESFWRMRDLASGLFGSESWQVHVADSRLGGLYIMSERAEEGVELVRSGYAGMLGAAAEGGAHYARETARSVAGLAAWAGDTGAADTQALLLDLLAEWDVSEP